MRQEPAPVPTNKKPLIPQRSCQPDLPPVATWAFTARATPANLRTDKFLLMSGSFVHKIIIAGCRCFASPLPSGLTKRDTMPKDDQHAGSTTTSSSRWYLFALTLMAIVIGVALFILTRGDKAANSASSSQSPEATIAPTTTKTSDTKSEVVTRLGEILEIREQAFRERDASLFDDVYTSNCSCLRAGRDAIAALKKERVRWKDRSISIEVESARSVNNKLWEVVALFVADSFRIETDEGILVRDVPAERLRYRFLIVRASDTGPWLLGSASPVEG